VLVFGELGLRPFTGHQGRRASGFTGGQDSCYEGRSERMARGLPLWVIGGGTSALAESEGNQVELIWEISGKIERV
jgi:hypothetical protein